jgi:aryl-alcohol dehydrogenase-like predicted oxidoreductase
MVLNGELLEMPHEIYVQSDPPRMYKVMRQTKKPCFAFKVLAAGRITGKGVEQAFRTAFDSIKPTDAIYVGMFPRYRDEVKENAEIVQRILST